MEPGTKSRNRRIDLAPILHRARQGDAAAIEQLLARYRPYLRVACGLRVPQLCRHREDASDIVQVTLVEATNGLAEFWGQTITEFEQWLNRLLECNVLQSIRRHTAGKRDVRLERHAEGSGDGATLFWHSLTCNGSSPASSVFRGEAALQLAEALERLPDDQRIAVQLRYLSQLPLREIAEEMEKTMGAVAGLLRRGVEGLRPLLPLELSEGWSQ